MALFKTYIRLAQLVKGNFDDNLSDKFLFELKFIPKTMKELVNELLKHDNVHPYTKHLFNGKQFEKFSEIGLSAHIVNDDTWPAISSWENEDAMDGESYCIDKINHNDKHEISMSFHILVLMFPKNDSQNILELSPQLSDTTPPIILLDIDGVINCLSTMACKDGTWETYYPDIKQSRVETMTITWSPTMVKRINKWADIAEIRWLTSWGHRAVRAISPALGFKKFKVATFYKECTAKGLTQEELNRPIVWIDDFLYGLYGFDSIEFAMKEFEKVHKGERLLIDPAEHFKDKNIIGLIPNDLDRVDKFLEKFS